jgi:copper(I)-binding protein
MLIFRTLSLLLLCLNFTGAYAQSADISKSPAATPVTIKDAWVRPTNPGQAVGAAYMTLTSSTDASLSKIESSVTKSIEIHSMAMQNGVMKMRMVDKLTLTAGKPYILAPGGYHLMLFDLKKPLREGEQVNFTLYFTDKKNAAFQQSISVPVKSHNEQAHEGSAHEHHH